MSIQDKVGVSKKEETLGRLYALRAGLSVVAQEKEQADGIMAAALRAKENAVDTADDRIRRAQDNLGKQKSK